MCFISVLSTLWLDLLLGSALFANSLLKKTWITLIERRRYHSYLSAGIVWFTICIPALGVEICRLSSYFRAVCFHAFSRYFLLISHGLGLVFNSHGVDSVTQSDGRNTPKREAVFAVPTVPLHLCMPDACVNTCKRKKCDFPTPTWIKPRLCGCEKDADWPASKRA